MTHSLRFRDALREAMIEEMDRDDRVFLMGEEVGHYQGAYKVSEGMLAKFGPRRVIATPIAEAGFAARRIGAQRPFVVADPGIIAAGWADELSQHLADADLPATFWSGLTPNPKDFEIAEGYQRYRELGCDVIIAIGGGSCLDAAKGIAILNAVRLVFDNLPRIVDRDATGDLRDHMAQASLEAGMAFTNALLGATHAMSHQVGGLLDLPHGVVNGVLLPHVIRFNAAVAPDRFVPLAQAAGLAVAPGMPGEEAGYMLADRVRAIADELGVPRSLAELGVAPGSVPTLAANALADACLATNPRPVSQADLAALFHAAL